MISKEVHQKNNHFLSMIHTLNEIINGSKITQKNKIYHNLNVSSINLENKLLNKSKILHLKMLIVCPVHSIT